MIPSFLRDADGRGLANLPLGASKTAEPHWPRGVRGVNGRFSLLSPQRNTPTPFLIIVSPMRPDTTLLFLGTWGWR